MNHLKHLIACVLLFSSCVAGPATVKTRIKNGGTQPISVRTDELIWKVIEPGDSSDAANMVWLKSPGRERIVSSNDLRKLGYNQLQKTAKKRYWGGIEVVFEVTVDNRGNAWVQDVKGCRLLVPESPVQQERVSREWH